MLSHEEIYNCLALAFPPSGAFGTRLVARHFDDAMDLAPGRAHIFLPDCHLLAKKDADKYPNTHFVMDEEYSRLLNALVLLKAGHRGELAVTHLGDLMDLWRVRGNIGDKDKADRITAAYASVLERLTFGPPGGLRADLLAGNHDYMLHELAEWKCARFRILENADGSAGDALLLHGDQFDWVERTFPDDVQGWGVRLARFVSAGRHELDQEQKAAVAEANQGLPTGDSPIGAPTTELAAPPPDPLGALPDDVNVVEWNPQTATTKATKFYKVARALALELKHHGHDVRLVVIGHTHSARIVTGERGDGVPLVLMDCGAWLGQCRLGVADPWRGCAQVGALVGNDLRIYQLV